MKKYLPWFILILAILILVAFIKNLITPTQKTTGFIVDIKKCGQISQLGYCSGVYSCGVRCNSCGCDKPLCNYDETCKKYFEANFSF